MQSIKGKKNMLNNLKSFIEFIEKNVKNNLI